RGDGVEGPDTKNLFAIVQTGEALDDPGRNPGVEGVVAQAGLHRMGDDGADLDDLSLHGALWHAHARNRLKVAAFLERAGAYVGAGAEVDADRALVAPVLAVAGIRDREDRLRALQADAGAERG